MSLNPAQQQAVTAHGNVVVVAGAGTGKTRTLVERCLHCLVAGQPPASLDQILMVTFTDAAAAEMRQRIRQRLEEEFRAHPEEPRWPEQLALFESARIGTLHSFCLQLVRQHFYQLELDPQLAVMPEEQARLLAEETLDQLLRKHYSAETPAAKAVQQLIQVQGRGQDALIRALVLRLHHYAQSLPHPEGWVAQQLAIFDQPEPVTWRDWFQIAVVDWRERSLPILDRQAGNPLAANCAQLLRASSPEPGADEVRHLFADVADAIAACPRGKKTVWVEPLEDFREAGQFLGSLVRGADGADPLAQDWDWVRGQMAALLRFVREFATAFSEAKRELGMVDFHDLEQLSLRLLWDAAGNRPTEIAEQWRRQLRFVFVDEYQDINAAQDRILEALSRGGADANRFLVGDLKQSIYRFRLANPRIFQGYLQRWSGGAGLAIPLVENFRSREGILNFVNSVFGELLVGELGGMRYDESARLRFGAPQQRHPLSVAADPTPPVELLLRLKAGRSSSSPDSGLGDLRDLEEADKEARLVARRLREIRASGFRVWDDGAGQFRPVAWRDMAVLLRSPSNKAEAYARQFAQAGLPLQVARRGFYQSLEISDLLNLLQVLDNPLQDIPLLAVLHSPLVGLSLDELAEVRLVAPRTRFWAALVLWAEEERPDEPGATTAVSRPKIAAFLERFARWRRLARQASLSRCLEAVLAETHYAEWLFTQPRGGQRHANVRRFVDLAREFDQFQRRGLFRFLRFLEAQQLAELEPDVAAAAEEDAVRLMSIHQSKGLEFPVVAVADLGKPFNLADLRSDLILDEIYGLGPTIKPPHAGTRYPSLPHWLARQRQLRELLGEELRLLYVALTRARDRLVLSGSILPTQFERWLGPAAAADSSITEQARSYADWLGQWFARRGALAGQTAADAGQNDLLRWRIWDETQGPELPPAPEGQTQATEAGSGPGPETWETLRQRLAWRYRFAAAAQLPAKTSVSSLRRRAARDEDAAMVVFGADRTEKRSMAAIQPSGPAQARKQSASPLAGAAGVDIGDAHHAFLQHVALDQVGSLGQLQAEAQRLLSAGQLTPEAIALLDFEALLAFWGAELGGRIRSRTDSVRRELAFTARFSPRQIAQVTGQEVDPAMEDEFVVVQGTADLVVILPKEIWLVDFKTDRVGPGQVAERAKQYRPQLQLYADALARIYDRPVTERWLYFLHARVAAEVKE